jgi:hypothetical protein
LVATVIGCGNNGLNNGQDMSGVGGGGDMGVDDGGDDMSGAVNCDYKTNTGCASGEKCVPAVGGTQMNPTVVGHCVTDGTVTEGATCMRGTMGGPDNCVGGLICSTAGAPMGMPVCRKLCTADSSCTTSGQLCAAGRYGNFIGTCLPSCTPFAGTGCATGMDCSVAEADISSTMTTTNGFFACKTTGTANAFDACMRSTDCGTGLRCDTTNGWCVPICDNSHPCAQPPVDAGAGTLSCMAFANSTSGAGICQ